MKKLLFLLMMPMILAACAPPMATTAGPASTASQAAATQLANAQNLRNAACKAWLVTFKAALAARQSGVASPTLIQQINLADTQFTPICSNPVLPTDPQVLTNQAIQVSTSMLTMEALLKELKK